ncbi:MULTISPECIES: NAD(P)/FAD-dependent oxidoreductase [unclassified Mucilaginibacter]|uniref:phytoene desaturase family protein n=1 Tax=unclassified Mucilaginibacter TaxID=2617802 RepID=UPI002AC8C294|nr:MULTISPECIES: NAD(P)/FAD-dependent oxidoreductase [unclassified Mucilaginibacter]MEB0249258.1 NAD(P)/FAD-dependent oxidoreductase [Mucilaginibacter sp. 5B2]MEB0262744.1 NAD(P)/FAD-dependent oxidoreductase [Mucilaginibacter sp. 10I4]MEB0279515.1 NAD(P)/FAD-dependent oxidoreductase [Mucilaginibacter sp. 10B2]MEB0302551.1 NAD(P)/FAD-dependent oxidoreductase [Mucilaginibacter sp. 5C4]WPX22617.1 NAD(P)/FAD-dependent oxidoreductase [Mucilaginibacter sp. 5C4]
MLEKRDFDAIIVGSGPNGLAAAILMQQNGLKVLLLEAKSEIGGGLRTAELTLPGFKHDICSAIHPLAAASPFLKTLPLADFGLNYIYPEIDAAHPLEHAKPAILCRSIDLTAQHLGEDEQTYRKLMGSVTKNWPLIDADILGPLHFPKHPLALASFGLDAIKSATMLANQFKTKQAKALIAGMAAHAIQPITNLATSAIALVLMAAGHLQGWPIPKGGSNSIANALAAYFESIGGNIQTDTYIKSLDQLPSTHAILFDITPKQLLAIAGHKFSSIYKWQLERYRYGMGVYKVDWALSEQIPFEAEACRKAGTVHLGNTLNEIRDAEQQTWNGKHPDKPYVLLAQQSLYDDTRAPKGKHTAWAYCHVPNGSTKNMTEIIERQIERYAPGFKDTILAKHTMDTTQMEEYNPNYIGGDINGGVIDLGQLFTRPALRYSPYKTSEKGMYICSSSTPPGGGVHGMCGYYAAKKALKDVFDISVGNLNSAGKA